MDASGRAAVRQTTPFSRFFLWQLGVTLFVFGFPLYVLTAHTDDYFAWTIDVSLTAAFLGACYWGSAVLAVLCGRERVWARARLPVPGGFLAGTLLLVATLVHIDLFHTDTVIGWVWLIAYGALPGAFVVLIVTQLRAPGGDPPTAAPLSGGAKAALLPQAAVLLGIGAALVVAPGETESIWPWKLTDLTAQAIGAFLIGIGATVLAAVREADWTRLVPPMLGYTVIAVLQLVALARYSDTPDWDDPSTWLYLLFVLSALVVGLFGLVAALRSRSGGPETRHPSRPAGVT